MMCGFLTRPRTSRDTRDICGRSRSRQYLKTRSSSGGGSAGDLIGGGAVLGVVGSGRVGCGPIDACDMVAERVGRTPPGGSSFVEVVVGAGSETTDALAADADCNACCSRAAVALGVARGGAAAIITGGRGQCQSCDAKFLGALSLKISSRTAHQLRERFGLGKIGSLQQREPMKPRSMLI